MAVRRLYFDNAATSFPKPRRVHEAMLRYATDIGASPGRGAYAEAREGGRLIARCRERINTLINGEDPRRVVFTLNTTDALNLAIRGVAAQRRIERPRTPIHMVTSAMDHNSVLRPLNALAEEDPLLHWTCVEVDPATGLLDPDDLRRAVRADTALVAVVHASNATGVVQPIGRIGAICRELGVPLLVDAAQSLGHMPIDVRALNVDLLAFPGHKGLLGPLGTGGLYLRPGMERRVRAIRQGGTGTVSEKDVHPETLPEKYEPGSHNAIGIVGLSEGVAYLLERGIDDVWRHERRLIRVMLDGLAAAGDSIRLIGPATAEHRVGVFSIVLETLTPHELADRLEQGFGVLVRPGIHCAPRAHRAMGTLTDDPRAFGATRLSLGPFLGEPDVAYACRAVDEICRSAACSAAV